ncbi:MAG: hypothetical protein AVDCRST_MAG88-1506, partial [uncultured Thermomicrobiales bacterium]
NPWSPTESTTQPPSSRIRTTTAPPSGEYLSALVSRFVSTCWSRLTSQSPTAAGGASRERLCRAEFAGHPQTVDDLRGQLDQVAACPRQHQAAGLDTADVGQIVHQALGAHDRGGEVAHRLVDPRGVHRGL